jgi:uncharacterized protein (TIGR03435 family)
MPNDLSNRARIALAGMICLLVTGTALSQILHADGPPPSFEVATIKPSKEPPQGGVSSGAEVHLIVTAKLLIELAYNVPMASDSRVTGGPDWINTDVYDVVAKPDAATFASVQKMKDALRRERQQLMEQSLLADRLGLKVHFETKDLPSFALTAGKGGAKLKPADDSATPRPAAPGDAGSAPPSETPRPAITVSRKGSGFEMIAKGVTMDGFLHALTPRPELRGRTVLDHSGIAGRYDFTLDWGPDQATAIGGADDSDEPPLFAAIEQQLGLKLVQSKAPAEVIVIDHIERPSEN